MPVKQGTLYPVLRSLEAGGLLSSEVEPSVAGPPRRYYQVDRGGPAGDGPLAGIVGKDSRIRGRRLGGTSWLRT